MILTLIHHPTKQATFISSCSLPTPFQNEDNTGPHPHPHLLFHFSRNEKIKRGKEKPLPHSSHLSTTTPLIDFHQETEHKKKKNFFTPTQSEKEENLHQPYNITALLVCSES